MPRKAVCIWSAISTCVLFGLLESALAETTIIDSVVAVVNDQVILLSEINERAKTALDQLPQTLSEQETKEKEKEVRKQILELLINEALVDQKVIEHKIEITDADLQRKVDELIKLNKMTKQQFVEALQVEGKTLEELYDQMRSQMKKEKLMSTQMQMNPELKSKMQVSDGDIQSYYNQYYSKAEKVRASHILFIVANNASAENQKAIQDRAQAVLEKIRAGASFEEMAKQFSDDPSGSTGGDLGWFGRGDMVASFEKAAYGLKKDQVSSLVRTRFGFHIIKLTDRVKEDPPALESVRGEIYQRLFGRQYHKAVQAWLDQLRKEAYIEIKL